MKCCIDGKYMERSEAEATEEISAADENNPFTDLENRLAVLEAAQSEMRRLLKSIRL